jgi:hypothetical protein
LAIQSIGFAPTDESRYFSSLDIISEIFIRCQNGVLEYWDGLALSREKDEECHRLDFTIKFSGNKTKLFV